MLLCLVFMISATAAPVTREQARQKAQAFLMKQNDSRQLKAVTNSRRLAPKKGSATDPYYVFERDNAEGFIIVSGDDQTIDVLGYTDSGSFDFEQLPPQLQDMLNDYARQIEAIRAGAPVLKLPANHPKVETFMGCKWSQGNPYNLLCPLDAGSRSVTGCVATAMAQILYYNREKSVTETTADIPGYSTYTKGINVPGIAAGAPIDWDNMKDTYSSASDRQKQAVAQLMLYCGVAVEMDYTNSSSGAQIYMVAEACKNYFGYGNSVKFLSNFSSEDEMDKIVYNELAAGRPVYLGGYNADAGHAFLTCGYENQRYYINWGWGGQSDGYYYLTNLTPGDGQGIGGSADGYNSGKTCIIGLEPENFGEKAMSFADAAVKKICVEKWDADGDGKLTYNEAAAVSELGDAFKGNTTIKKFPELYYFTSVTTLPDDAFNGCKQLTALRLPKALKYINARALKDCQKLTQINLPASVSYIGEEAFANCQSLTEFELPNDITVISSGMLKNCSLIKSIDLPINVEALGSEAFDGCTRLSSFTVNTYHPANIVMDPSVFGNLDLSKVTLHVMQGTKSFFETTDQWKDFGNIIQTRDISAGLFAELEAGKTFYLYNVGTGQYLTKGEAYKTQAVVGTEPMRFKPVHPAGKPEGVYYFTSPDTGKEGKYLFRTSSDGNVGDGVKACFVDGTALTNAYWNIQKVEDQIYTIQVPSTESTYVEGEFLGVQTDHESNASSPTYGAYYDVTYDTHKRNCQWQLVLYDEKSTELFNEAEILGNLLSIAKKENAIHEEEQKVYDNLESTIEQIQAAQSSLRKRLKFIDFANKDVRNKCIDNFDSDTNGELSYKEASEVTDFGWLFNFMGNTSLVTVEELQYFTHATAIHGNFMQDCINLEKVILPEGLEKIYYWAFKGCKKLMAINIPEYVDVIGEAAFEGCTALREVTIENPVPANINLGEDLFKGVPLAQCTLYVPYGSKELYAQADVWKDFGTIVEIRAAHTQPQFSYFTTGTPGYLYNIGTRKMITMGEAYGTQSVVARTGRPYYFTRTDNMAEGVYYLYDSSIGRVIFRTTTDKNVGEGVKACFGDGSLSERGAKSYWKLDSISEKTYTLQVPEKNVDYVEGEYLGCDNYHKSNASSPTNGIYWDIKGITPYTQWAFVTEDDMKAAQEQDNTVKMLKKLLLAAKAKEIDATKEQAVYDNLASTAEELEEALNSLREKLHFITFSDSKTQSVCLKNWDTDNDGELTLEEAQAVTDIGDAFAGSNIVTFEEFKYFTSVTHIPDNAFRNASDMKVLYVPAYVISIGSQAFSGCTELLDYVFLNDSKVIPFGSCGMLPKATLFLPKNILASYEADEVWKEKVKRMTEYTGKPVVTAEATRIYGRTYATVTTSVLGAPVNGTPEVECELIEVGTTPVGTYPMKVKAGTITTPGVELRDGVLTITPATLKCSTKSYTREVGQPNPTFELSISGFRNRETVTVLTKMPTLKCEATINSPAGEYPIVISGGEAQNYVFEYQNGVLTITDPVGIKSVEADDADAVWYDMQGRRVNKAGKGIYVKGNKKVVIK